MTGDDTRNGQDAQDALDLPRRGVVRPYVLTRGRTTSSLGSFELHAPVLALIATEQLGRHATPEDRKIVELCQTPTSVAELSARAIPTFALQRKSVVCALSG